MQSLDSTGVSYSQVLDDFEVVCFVCGLRDFEDVFGVGGDFGGCDGNLQGDGEEFLAAIGGVAS
jgi:hypothetical protein